MVLISLVLPVFGQSDAGKHLSLDVREVASGTTAQYNWATSWGSYDRTIYGSKALRVSIRNLGRVQGTAHVTVYFYDASYSQVGTADGDLDLKGQIEAVAVLNVPVTVSREVNLASIGSNTTEGVRPPVAWAVTGRLGGKIFAIKASTRTLQDLNDRALREGSLN